MTSQGTPCAVAEAATRRSSVMRSGVRATMADEPGGMPGRAAGEPPLLDEHDVALAHLRQVIGDGAADHAAADDDDLGGGGEVGAHRFETTLGKDGAGL